MSVSEEPSGSVTPLPPPSPPSPPAIGSAKDNPFVLTDSPFSDLSLVDLLVSFDATIELLSRAIRQQGKRVERNMEKRRKALEELLKREGWGEAEREVERLKLRVEERMKALSVRWNETKIVSLRERISFFFGVNNIVATVVLLGFYPTYIPLYYTLQALVLLPWRLYSYKQKDWHYFLFDLCYYINGLLLIWLWIFPSSSALYVAVWGLANGPLATAVLTWRNSLVFHSIDKVTSLYIHLYPPLVLMTIKHFYPAEIAAKRYPSIEHAWGWKGFLILNSIVYLIWQGAYWYFVIEQRREKIKNGRVTSFTYLLNDKKGTIGRMLTHIAPKWKEPSFMLGQLVYTILTTTPAILYHNYKSANVIFVASMFAVAVWNGASFYVEVWGRRFEKELVKLRKEFESLTKEKEELWLRSGTQSGVTTPPNEPEEQDESNLKEKSKDNPPEYTEGEKVVNREKNSIVDNVLKESSHSTSSQLTSTVSSSESSLDPPIVKRDNLGTLTDGKAEELSLKLVEVDTALEVEKTNSNSGSNELNGGDGSKVIKEKEKEFSDYETTSQASENASAPSEKSWEELAKAAEEGSKA